MSKVTKPKYSTLYFEESVETRGWFKTHRYLLLRRLCQITVILLFAIPIAGVNSNIALDKGQTSPDISQIAFDNLKNEDSVRRDDTWIMKGTLANSEILSTVPLGDPFIFVQSVAARNFYTWTGVLGVAIITLFYFVLGGRTYCSFVCPVNIVTDLSGWIRRQLRINNQLSISRKARFYIMGIVIVISALFQVIAWELINPITGIFRVMVYGGLTLTNIAVAFVLVIFIMDIIGAANLWCGHLCPVGAFYNLLGKRTVLHVSAPQIAACDDCMDCYKACPEPHVLRPLIQNKETFIEENITPSIGFSDCTRCGRCIDVCPEGVFGYAISTKHFRVKDNKPKVKVS